MWQWMTALCLMSCAGSPTTTSRGKTCTLRADNGDPDDNQPDFSQCDPDEACVVGAGRALDADDGLMFSCLELQGTPPPGQGFGASGADGWATYEVPAARCNNGERARFYFRPAVDLDGTPVASDEWLVFLKGGGGCTTPLSCAVRWQTHAGVMQPRPPNWVPPSKGIFQPLVPGEQGRSRFAGAHQVYVHYCSSDYWRGVGHPDSDDGRSPNTGLFHHGRLIVEEVMDALVEGLPYEGTSHALQPGSTVVLAGGSAGSGGVASSLDAVAVQLAEADVEVRGLLDSLLVPIILPADQVALEPDYAEALDAHCESVHGKGARACRDVLHLVTGRDLVDADQGHLGLQPGGEAAARDTFAYMSAVDGLMFAPGGICTPRVCEVDGDCPADGDRCRDGRCSREVPDPEAPEACDHGGTEQNLADPLGLACWTDEGVGEPGPLLGLDEALVAQCRSVLKPSGEVGEAFAPADADGDCGAGFTCMSGYCVRAEHEVQCDRAADCPGERDLCLSGTCVHGADPTTETCDDIVYTTAGTDPDTCVYRPAGGCVLAGCPRALDTCTDVGMCEHPAAADGACADVVYEFEPEAQLCLVSAGCRSEVDCLPDELCLRTIDMPAGGPLKAGVLLGFEPPGLPDRLTGYTIRSDRERHTILNATDEALFTDVTWVDAAGGLRTMSVYDALVSWLDEGGSTRVQLVQEP